MPHVLLTHLNHAYGLCLPLELLRAHARTHPDLRRDVRFSVRPFDFAREFYGNSQGVEVFANTASAIAAEGPDVVAYSTYIWNRSATESVARAVRQLVPDALQVLGGGEFLTRVACARALEQMPWIDAIVVGEGEATFQELLLRFLDGGRRALREVSGLVLREGREILVTPARAPIADLDVIPSPFTEATAAQFAGAVLLETYRGCPFRCSFCTFPKALSGLRRYSTERVISDLRRIHAAGQRTLVWFVDSVFNLPLERTREILRFLAESQLAWSAEFQAEILTPEMVDLLAQTNIQHYDFGLQSTDPDVLASVERTSFKPEKFARNVRLVMEHPRNAGRTVNLQAIFGLPGETYATFRQTVDYALRQAPLTLSLFRLCLLPGSKLDEESAERGIVCLPDAPYEVMRTDAMSLEDVRRADRLRRGVQLAYNSGLARNVLLFLDAWVGLSPARVCELFYDYIEGLMGEARANVHSVAGTEPGRAAEFLAASRVFFERLLEGARLTPRRRELLQDALALNTLRVELSLLRPGGALTPVDTSGAGTRALQRARLTLSPRVRLHLARFEVHEERELYRVLERLDRLEPAPRPYALVATGARVALRALSEDAFRVLQAYAGRARSGRQAMTQARRAGWHVEQPEFLEALRGVPPGLLVDAEARPAQVEVWGEESARLRARALLDGLAFGEPVVAEQAPSLPALAGA